jgi:hypothetical protein
MDTTKFKKIIKESVREAIQEELRDILLEAIKTPKNTITETVSTNTYTQPQVSQPKQLTPAERKTIFSNMLEDMQTGGIASTNNIAFRPSGPIDPFGGTLPDNELGLDQIMGLMNK